MGFPQEVQVNAWTGTDGESKSPLGSKALAWGVSKEKASQKMGADDPADLRNWRDPKVGWGVVLPENLNIPPEKRALAEDAPPPIRRLWEERQKAPVFRYQAGAEIDKRLRRYSTSGSAKDPAISATDRGTAEHLIPRYLLICGPPTSIPWSFQYHLNLSSFVGRLDLSEQGLDNYVSALLDDWPNSKISSNRPVVWSVDHQNGDITTLMQKAIAEPLAKQLRSDDQIGSELRELFSADATNEKLISTLIDRKPALVVSTSHGSTPLSGSIEELRAKMGLLVDQNNSLLNPTELLNHWSPDGAIWYAHACCGAGTDDTSSYRNLFDINSSVGGILDSVTKAGSTTSRFPNALLSCKRPLRAFVGQIEPTFDWTIRESDTNQLLTSSILDALYNGLHRTSGHEPISMTFEKHFSAVGSLLSAAGDAADKFISGEMEFKSVMVRKKVAAFDRRSLVVLGDPTATLPALG